MRKPGLTSTNGTTQTQSSGTHCAHNPKVAGSHPAPATMWKPWRIARSARASFVGPGPETAADMPPMYRLSARSVIGGGAVRVPGRRSDRRCSRDAGADPSGAGHRDGHVDPAAYRVGRIFHAYRPRAEIVDGRGRWRNQQPSTDEPGLVRDCQRRVTMIPSRYRASSSS